MSANRPEKAPGRAAFLLELTPIPEGPLKHLGQTVDLIVIATVRKRAQFRKEGVKTLECCGKPYPAFLNLAGLSDETLARPCRADACRAVARRLDERAPPWSAAGRAQAIARPFVDNDVVGPPRRALGDNRSLKIGIAGVKNSVDAGLVEKSATGARATVIGIMTI